MGRLLIMTLILSEQQFGLQITADLLELLLKINKFHYLT